MPRTPPRARAIDQPIALSPDEIAFVRSLVIWEDVEVLADSPGLEGLRFLELCRFQQAVLTEGVQERDVRGDGHVAARRKEVAVIRLSAELSILFPARGCSHTQPPRRPFLPSRRPVD